MPAYAYLCERCGVFERWCSLKEASGAPTGCPTCAAEARRLYTAPGLVKTPAALTQRRDRAHKSAYEPEVVKRQPVAPDTSTKTPVIGHGHGRPWQLGH